MQEMFFFNRICEEKETRQGAVSPAAWKERIAEVLTALHEQKPDARIEAYLRQNLSHGNDKAKKLIQKVLTE